MRNRSLFLVLILAGALSSFAAPAFAAQTDPSGWLELDAGTGSAMQRLTPGESVHWTVDVHVRGEAATSLEMALPPSSASDLLRGFLSVELRVCSEPWAQDQCGSGERVLLQRTPLTAAEGLRTSLKEPGTSASSGSYMLLTATLAEDAPREVQGRSTQILVRVDASGDDPGAGVPDEAGTGAPPGLPDAPSPASLADTGARLGGFALLGLVAVAVGFGLARLRAAA